MTTVYDVPAAKLITKAAEKLKGNAKINPPEWTSYVKTGMHREKAPERPDWWYTRVAAVLRKVYINTPIGINHLSAMFGGAVDRGSKRYHAKTGSRSIIRYSLQQLEEAGLVNTVKGKGRSISPAGQKFLDNTAHEVLQDIIMDNPELGKY